MHHLSREPDFNETDAKQRGLLLQFYVSAAAFAALLFLSGHLHSAWDLAVHILTFAIAAFGLWSFYQLLSLADERQKEINYRALRFAFLATLLLSLLAGFVRGFASPQVSCGGILAVMLIAWSGGLILFSWRFR